MWRASQHETNIVSLPGEASMTEGAFYVYALKDPRTSPAKPFYIGKGVGTRAWDHLLTPDDTAKGKRIAEIETWPVIFAASSCR
jgi:hypothetical protein